MIRQIQETEATIAKLDKQHDELSIFIVIAQDCMDKSADEPEWLSFWDKHNRLCKLRNDVRFRRFTAKAFLSVKKAEARVTEFFS